MDGGVNIGLKSAVSNSISRNVYRAMRIAFKIDSLINDIHLLQLNLLINSPFISTRNFHETNTSCIRLSRIISRIVMSSINQSSSVSSATRLYSHVQYRVNTLEKLHVNSKVFFRTAILWHGVKVAF